MQFLSVIISTCGFLASCLSSQVTVKISGIVGSVSRAHRHNRDTSTNRYEMGGGDGTIELKFTKSDETAMFAGMDDMDMAMDVDWNAVTPLSGSEVKFWIQGIQGQTNETLDSSKGHIQGTHDIDTSDCVTFRFKTLNGKATIEALVTE